MNDKVTFTTVEKKSYNKNEIFLSPLIDAKKRKQIMNNTFEAIEYFKLEKFQYLRNNSNINLISNNLQVKIKVNNFTNVNYEKKVISNISNYKEMYFFWKPRIYAKKMIKGKIKKQLTKKNIKELVHEMKYIHSCKTHNVEKYSLNLPGKKVLTHGDIRDKNVIFGTEKAFLIDFEWARINSYLWDIASVIINWKMNSEMTEYLIKEYGQIDKKELNVVIQEVKKINNTFNYEKYILIK